MWTLAASRPSPLLHYCDVELWGGYFQTPSQHYIHNSKAHSLSLHSLWLVESYIYRKSVEKPGRRGHTPLKVQKKRPQSHTAKPSDANDQRFMALGLAGVPAHQNGKMDMLMGQQLFYLTAHVLFLCSRCVGNSRTPLLCVVAVHS